MKRHLITTVALTVSLLSFSISAQEAQDGWKSYFADGTLSGGQVVSGTASYQVKDGVLTGTTTEGSPNSFLILGPFKDFELEFDVQVDDALNSGVQVRSHLAKEGDAAPEGSKNGKPLPVGRLYGPQCEIAVNGTAGDFYDEARRGTWWSLLTKTESVRSEAAKAAFKKGEWNHYRIVVKGDHYQSFVNEVPTADFRQPGDAEGYIGFQVHGIKKGAGPFSVRWKNVKIRESK
jgi:Domain of Unknown Function (DUF1080)